MRQITSEEIQSQFETLPVELQRIVTSPEIHDKVEAIGKKYSLMVDQLGELVDEIGLILLGLEKSSDFVVRVSERLNISSKASMLIAKDVNTEIFDSIKDILRSNEASSESFEGSAAQQERGQAVSSLERVGGFSVERESPESSNGVTSADRPQILAGLENPPSSLPGHTATPPANLPTSSTQVENHSEPLVDYLLSNPAGRAAQNIPVTAPTPAAPKKPAPPVAPQVPKNDPYKESI